MAIAVAWLMVALCFIEWGLCCCILRESNENLAHFTTNPTLALKVYAAVLIVTIIASVTTYLS